MKIIKLLILISVIIVSFSLANYFSSQKVVEKPLMKIGVGGGTILTYTVIDFGTYGIIPAYVTVNGGNNDASFYVYGDAEANVIVNMVSGGSGYSAGVTYSVTNVDPLDTHSGLLIRVDSVTGGGANTNNFFSFFN